MSVTTSTYAFQLWDALVAKIKAEAVPGGRLATLTDVEQSAELQRGAVGPCCAVQLAGWPDPVPVGIPRRLKIEMEFKILIGTRSIDVDTRPANLGDAMLLLRPLVDDGAGNGIVAVLNDRATFTLGGNSYQSRLGPANFDWDLRNGPGQAKWAYFLQSYHATGEVNF